jgi:hypothetical protein
MLARMVALIVAVPFAVACSDAPDSAKKPLPVCDAKDPDCPGVASSAPKTPKADVPSDAVPVPSQQTEQPLPNSTPPTPAPSADAGVDAAPAMGELCTKLAACCTQLGDAGYDTKTCKSVLSTKNEDACYTQHASYKSFGDCS